MHTASAIHPLPSTIMASCSSSLVSHRWKYDVFLSFRGDDTRRGFTSHLRAALHRKALQTFFDDDGLERGEEIVQSLPEAIQDSNVAILVFSKHYAFSTWCLDELADIMECHRSRGQIVLPVFYEVDPSHLRKQSDDVAAAFVHHEQNSISAHKILRWKDALTEAASLSGLHSKEFRNDDLLINKIVKDILEKLNQSMPCDDFEHLVGMGSRIKEIKERFTINPSKTCILGIWGMGGSGKTTTAEVIYKMMSRQFQDCCFVYNVRQRAEASGINKLQEELILKIFGEKDSVKYIFNIGLDLLKRMLGRKKVLIVLDDVNNSLQLESLIGDPCWFSLGSMILVTSRNKQVFEGRDDFIYEVKLLNDDEALQLFNKKAFKQNYPRDDYASLSKSIVEYAQGNPLALKVLGSTLNGKNYKEWESALTQLSRVQNNDIYQVLQISYNDLSRVEKGIFLDIACFFQHVGGIYVKEDIMRKKYKNREFDIDIMRKIYKSSGFDIGITLSVLADKCLIVISKYRLNMHDLLQELGKEIVRREAKYSYQLSRLWDPQDIYAIFAGNKVAEAVETITLDLSKIREMNLNPQVFMKMPNLRFLNFYGKSNLHFSQGLDDLPNVLQYLRWDKYPLESLPPSSLLVLQLSNNNIKQLWIRAEVDSLLPRVKYGIVNGFWKLTFLSLAQNKSITHFPNGRSGFLEGLDEVDLRGSSNLNEFPEISSSIKRLYLSGTAIKQVPSSSLELLSKLEYLEMQYCKELESLPSNFFSKLTSLCTLDLRGCSRFKMLPEILEPTRCLVLLYLLSEIFGPTRRSVFLNLSETAIEKLPSFIGICNETLHIDMSNCWNLAFNPRSSENCFSEDIFWASSLNISSCKLRELPEDLSFPSFIVALDLSENDFERIPATVKRLSRLQILIMRYCKRLLSLPELPSNVYEIFAQNCRSLKEIWTLKQLSLDSRMKNYYFNFSNCLKLDEDKCREVVNALLRSYTSKTQESVANFAMIYPGSIIPEWVKYENMGDSIEIHLPTHWFNHSFLGFAFYLCLDKRQHGDDLRFDCYFGDNYHFSSDNLEECYVGGLDKEHMVVFVNTIFCEWVRRHSDFEEGVALFKFRADKNEIIKKCGVSPLYAPKDEDEFCGTFDFPNLGVSKLKRSATGAGSSCCIPEKRSKMEEVE